MLPDELSHALSENMKRIVTQGINSENITDKMYSLYRSTSPKVYFNIESAKTRIDHKMCRF